MGKDFSIPLHNLQTENKFVYIARFLVSARLVVIATLIAHIRLIERKKTLLQTDRRLTHLIELRTLN